MNTDSTTVCSTLQVIKYHKDNFLIGYLDCGVTVKGTMISPQIGMEYRFKGKWEQHPQYGRGLMFTEYEASYPTELSAVRAYLKENCKHIGPEISKKLVNIYGEATLRICKEEPARVAEEISGLTPERALKISAMLRNNEANEQLQIRLQEIVAGTKVSRRVLNRIIALYGQEAPEKIKKDPYQLIDEIEGVGFLTADELAIKVGYEKESYSRIAAGIVHVLKESSFSDGNTCLPVTMLMVKAKGVLQVEAEKVGHVLNGLIEGERLVAHKGNVYIPAIYEQERRIALIIKSLLKGTVKPGCPVTDGLQQDQTEALNKVMHSNVFILTGPPGTGKAQPLDAKILTPAGWTTMGTVKIGDTVINSKGAGSSITGVYPQGRKPVYRVLFSDGSSTECCEAHIWLTTRRDKRTSMQSCGEEPKTYSPVTLKEIIGTLQDKSGACNHSIPMIQAVEFPKRNLKVNPYILGVLLGDGILGNQCCGVSNPESEIIESVRQHVKEFSVDIQHIQKGDYRFKKVNEGKYNRFYGLIRELGLWAKRSHEKFVPADYLFSPAKDRLAVLQGLMDTDGYTDGHHAEFSTSSPRLAEDIQFIIESLGGTARINIKEPVYRHNGETRKGKISFRVSVVLPPQFEPFRLKRKRERYIPKTKYKPRRIIRSIEYIGLKETQCISVDASDNLYVTDHCILTHNTYTIKTIIRSFPDTRIALAAPSGKAAKRIYEESGMRAQTIHKLLEPQRDLNGFYFTRDAENPIDADIIILDEVSMIDTPLMASFLDAVKPETRLIMVGDTYQLPAVGPGNVLKDIILSGTIPSTELSIIKRQDAGLIIRNCHSIKNGQDIELNNSEAKDFYFLGRKSEEAIRETILDLITGRLKQSYDADPLKDIQIISPLRERTGLSCKAFNRECQERLNKNKPVDKCRFKEGDKVIQTRNEYDKDIINGDIGFIRSINTQEKSIFVDFENPPRLVELSLYENNLELAYAITCVTADTWIWTEKGMQRISDISCDLAPGMMKESDGSVGTHEGMKPIRRIMHIGEEPTVRIRTRTGLTLEMSLRHRILTVDRISGKEKWAYASDLKVGARLPIPRGHELGPACNVSTEEFRPAQHPNGRRNPAKWPSEIGESIAEVLGALVADGNYTDTKDARVEVGKADPWRSCIRKQIESLFGIKCRDRFERQRNVGNFYFHNKTVREFLQWCGLEYVTAPDKSVPWVILASPLRVQAAFLRGLFSGDGSVTSRIVLATASGLLAEQVQLLLLNLGIISKRYLMRAATSCWGPAWRIEISGVDVDLFNRCVGFAEAYKRDDAVFLRDDIPYAKTNWDTIPGGAHAARELRDALRNRDGRSYRASTKAKALLSRLAGGGTRLAYHHIDLLMREIEGFKLLRPVYEKWMRWHRNHWFYDKVVEIDKGRGDLYDLTVSDPHAYLSNGIISHNCHKFQGSEARIIIIPIHRSFGPLIMQRNWLYTAVSRAREVCILVGQRNEIPKIINRNRQQQRFTNLAGFLCEQEG